MVGEWDRKSGRLVTGFRPQRRAPESLRCSWKFRQTCAFAKRDCHGLASNTLVLGHKIFFPSVPSQPVSIAALAQARLTHRSPSSPSAQEPSFLVLISQSYPIQANYHLISFGSTLGGEGGPSFGTLLRSRPLPVLSRCRIVNTPAHERACDASKHTQPDQLQ